MASEPAPPVPRLPATISTGRPASWRDKSLPPLPGEMHGGGGAPRRMMYPSQYGHPPSQHPPPPQLETRPRTLFTYDADPSAALVAPHAPFRLEAGRRQSFGGLGSAPNMHMHVQTDAQAYAEFGAQRRAPPGPATATTTTTPTKRKSKFGFASLLGKKTTPVGKGQGLEREPQETGVEYPFPATATATAHSSGSEARHEAQMMGFGGAAPSMMSVGMSVGSVTSASGHQQLQQAQFPRMSMSLASKKNIEHLVDQAPDFVAYRYPSGDAPLGIMRTRDHRAPIERDATRTVTPLRLSFLPPPPAQTHISPPTLSNLVSNNARPRTEPERARKARTKEGRRCVSLSPRHARAPSTFEPSPVSQTVKDVVAELVSDGLVKSDKVGSSNYAFPSQAGVEVRTLRPSPPSPPLARVRGTRR
ncbi:hypothetical protein OF83DRAFT_1158913 [Amylostereum chailletii]|nr:hypothetical protein OF83DRAFT_1158913 [Amylostereum chailletii]